MQDENDELERELREREREQRRGAPGKRPQDLPKQESVVEYRRAQQDAHRRLMEDERRDEMEKFRLALVSETGGSRKNLIFGMLIRAFKKDGVTGVSGNSLPTKLVWSVMNNYDLRKRFDEEADMAERLWEELKLECYTVLGKSPVTPPTVALAADFPEPSREGTT